MAESSQDLAIVGMAGRFPGARDVDAFWANLVGGVESIRRLSDDELRAAGVSRRDFDDPSYVKACAVLDDIDQFDAAFFGLSPRDASVMDPAHRLFLEVAWHALEHAGNTGLPGEQRVGVWAGSGAPLYWMNNVRSHRALMASMGEFLVRHTGNDMNFLATRVSYDLDLRGPSINVQTACSSALVALHLARQSLLAGECDMALVGGATVVLPMGQGYHYKEGEILSPDGHCRPFDHRSAGTVFGSGAACLVVKRLDDALDNGDTIWAVVKGSAVNNDGALKVGFLAPGVDGQADAIRSALQTAGVRARDVSYVEAHGTGTSVGDPIEVLALHQVFSEQTADRGFCAIGSVKSNIGHLGEAAAAASLIKVVMALKHRQLPPTLGYEAPNPRFPMDESAFFVNNTLRAWQGDGPLIAGITALGAGGTNCHVVLAEPPLPLPGEGARGRELLVLSARTPSALERLSANLAEHLERHPDTDLADVAYTLSMGRRVQGHRRAVVADSAATAAAALRVAPVGSTLAAEGPSVVFAFPGGGAQYAGMGLDLYEREPVYREALDRCLAITDGGVAPGVREHLFARGDDAATQRLQRPSLALPALFATEYALAHLFEAMGLVPDAFIGHSMGEYVAACLTGVFSLEDGLGLVALRGRLFETTRRGTMVGVSLSEAELRLRMPAGLSLAAVNAPELCVASGPVEDIDAFSQSLGSDIDWTPVRIDVAAHSSLLDPILAEFRAFCRTIAFQPPAKPMVSNLTGGWLSAEQATNPDYWVYHLRGTVRFADGVETLLASGPRVFIEVGPGRTLTTLVAAQTTRVRHAFNAMRHPNEPADDQTQALLTLGRAWAAGAAVDWTALYDGQLRNRVPLPQYPFDHRSYWVAPAALQAEEDDDPARRDDIDDWFATPAWEPTPRAAAAAVSGRWLLVAADAALGRRLAQALQARGTDAPECVPMPVDAAAWRQLLTGRKQAGMAPAHVVLVPGGQGDGPARIDSDFVTPVHAAQALAEVLGSARLFIVTQRAFAVGDEAVDPWARLAWGVAAVVPREMPEFPTRLIDFDAAQPETLARLAAELASDESASPVVLRRQSRWTSNLRSVSLPAQAERLDWLADSDVVLITGGLGGIGLILAQHLASRRPLALALLAREALPPASQWAAMLAAPATPALLKRRIGAVQALQTQGVRVLVVAGDVTDVGSLKAALTRVRAELGPVAAVIHTAGVMDDEPLQTKTDERMHRVLAAKVLGAYHLDRLLADELKAFVVMSSVASHLGLPGQVDYTAANAFLDAFAHERRLRKPGRTLAINWNAWKDVGMVVDGKRAAGPLPAGATQHPWLAGAEPVHGGMRFCTDFAIESHWLLAEHRIAGGAALIPGTGLVELARAAFAEAVRLREGRLPLGQGVELTDVTFLKPFQVAPGETRRLQIDVTWQGAGAAVHLSSAGGREVHAAAEASWAPVGVASLALPPPPVTPRAQATRDGFLDQDFVQFGPRWRNLRRVQLGDGEALLELALPPEFVADLPALACHPALLDMATGGAQALIPGFRSGADFLVPFGYERLRVRAPLTLEIASRVRLRPHSTTDTASFDIQIRDTAGRLLLEAEGFTLRRVSADASIVGAAPSAPVDPALQALLRDAITPAEGVLAFERAVAQDDLAQVMASSVDVTAWQRRLEAAARRLGGDADGAPSFARPQLSHAVEGPRNDLERQLAVLWQQLLGIDEVGITDDFFELGGNSLVAVRLARRIEQATGLKCPLSHVFQHPRIADLAVAIGARAEASSSTLLLAEGASTLTMHYVCGQHVYRDVAKALAPLMNATATYLPIEQQLFENGEAPTSLLQVAEFASAYRDSIVSQQADGPYYLAGLSFGGIVAYEVAQQLQREGKVIGGVVLFDSVLPSAVQRDWGRWARDTLKREGMGIGAVLLNKALGKARHVMAHNAAGKADPTEAEREQALLKARDRYYLAAASAYQPTTADFPVVLVRASHRLFPDSDLNSLTYGWERLCRNFAVVDCEGDHLGIMSGANAVRVAQGLRGALAIEQQVEELVFSG